jgi:glycine cleavage system aminomethyltransferase T
MGYALYGHEIDETTTPLEAGLDWVVDFGGSDFLGKAALAAQRDRGIDRRLVGFELIDKGVPRQGHPILAEGRAVGAVTSGNLSPSLDKGIGMGYMKRSRRGRNPDRDRHSRQAQTGRDRSRPSITKNEGKPFHRFDSFQAHEG